MQNFYKKARKHEKSSQSESEEILQRTQRKIL